MWDGFKVSVRDRVKSDNDKDLLSKKYIFHSTDDIIKAANNNLLPDTIMFTIHPKDGIVIVFFGPKN